MKKLIWTGRPQLVKGIGALKDGDPFQAPEEVADDLKRRGLARAASSPTPKTETQTKPGEEVN